MYRIDFAFSAGSSNTDATQLVATLQGHGLVTSGTLPAVDATLTNGGGNTYFKSLGNGFWSFRYDSVPNDYIGSVVIKYAGVTKIVVGLRPQEVEYTDAKTSTVAAAAAAATQAALDAAHGDGSWEAGEGEEQVPHQYDFGSTGQDIDD